MSNRNCKTEGAVVLSVAAYSSLRADPDGPTWSLLEDLKQVPAAVCSADCCLVQPDPCTKLESQCSVPMSKESLQPAVVPYHPRDSARAWNPASPLPLSIFS